jgi:tRNA(Arg) A34 adenosine deaminase TadA
MTKKIDRRAKKEAKKSKCNHRHGAVLIFKGSIISSGHNRTGKSPRKGIHAELDCTLGVPKRLLFKSTVYVSRVNGLGKFVFSKPCRMCEKFLRRVVTSVYYTDEVGKWVKLF